MTIASRFTTLVAYSVVVVLQSVLVTGLRPLATLTDSADTVM